MKNNILKIAIIVFALFSLTGCTKYLQDDNKKVLKNPKTGQNIASNILCKPEDKNILKIYDDYNSTTKKKKVDIDSLPKCQNLPIKSQNYDGLWTTIFVQPLAFIIIQIGKLVKNYGLALIISTILIRLVFYRFTKNTAMQSENLKKAQSKIQKLEKKYANRNDQNSMMQKTQEMQMIYKEYNINPFSSCLVMLIQVPLFFAFYEAISRIPAIFEETFLTLQLGTSPSVGLLQQGKIIYLFVIIIVILATYFSFMMNRKDVAVNGQNADQMKMFTYVMIITMSIAAFSISSGIAIYWITSNVFTIIQNYIVKRGGKNDRNKKVRS